jgi:hypothetical protein
MVRPVLLAVLVAALGAPAALAATPWVGRYTVGVEGGQQVATWTIDHPDRGACDVSQKGGGSEKAAFQPGEALPLFAAGVAGGGVRLGAVSDLLLPALLDREATVAVGPDDGDDGPTFCPSGPPSTADASGADCGQRPAEGFLTLTPGAGGALAVSPGPTQQQGIGPPYSSCPLFGVPFPTLLAPALMVAPSLLGPRGQPAFSVEGSATAPASAPDVTGQTQTTLRLRFTRAFVTGSVALPPGVATLPVARDGTTALSLRCPEGGPRCGGSVALGLGTLSADVTQERAASAYPFGLASSEPAIATTRFALKPGRRGRVALRLRSGKRKDVRRFAGRRLDVVITARSGASRLAFVIGAVRIRSK